MDALAIAGFALSLLAWGSYKFVSRRPRLRRTMWPLWTLLALGVLLSAVGLSSGTARAFACSAGTFFSAGLFLIIYLFRLRLPTSGKRPRPGQPLPEFTLEDEHGNTVSPADYRERGPVLLVFFRGFW